MAKEPTIRELTLSILLEVTSGKTYSHIAIRNVLEKYAYFDAGKRAQIKRLSMGTLERMLLLDEVIGQFSNTPVKKQKPVIRNILRMAVYELLYMDSIPARATVNEAVSLTEKKGFHNLKGFVNGVLRSIVRAVEQGELTLPDSLSARYSMPQWIIDQWTEDYGKLQTEEILKGSAGEPPLTVHLATAHLAEHQTIALWQEEGVGFSEIKGIPGAYALSGIDRLTALESFRRGGFFVQDISSMKVLSALPAAEGMEILDICGAPGGKSLFLAERLHGTGHVLCRDLSETKTALIRENIERCGYANLTAETFDARTKDARMKDRADLVIADLPCSGLGVLKRKPDIRYRQSPETEKELAELQRNILDVAQYYVKPGGYLCYSTCTLDRMENEENARWFTATHPEFQKTAEEQLFPQALSQDGFYYALFRKER